jgi:hypothetical protein
MTANELHAFVVGQLRTDGWKSPWRIDLERRMAADANRTSVIRHQPQAKRVRSKEYMHDLYLKRKAKRDAENPRPTCSRCDGLILRTNKIGLCMDCRGLERRSSNRQKAKRPPRTCSMCDTRISWGNKSGVCTKHYHKAKRVVEMGPRPNCVECGAEIYRRNKLGKCRKCSLPFYKAAWREKKKLKAA